MSKFVIKFDSLKGYIVPLLDRAQEISAHITPSGLYEYTVLRLCNAPATFQLLKGCADYLDKSF